MIIELDEVLPSIYAAYAQRVDRMFFAYIMTTNNSYYVLLSGKQHKALLGPDPDVLQVLSVDLDEEGVDPADVLTVSVETGDDADDRGLPDATDPDTRRVFSRCALCNEPIAANVPIATGQASGPRGIILRDDQVAHQGCYERALV